KARMEELGPQAQALLKKYPEELTSLPHDHIPVEIQRPDGSVYPASFNGWAEKMDVAKSHATGDLHVFPIESIGFREGEGWSHGTLAPGDKLITSVPTPEQWRSGIREVTAAPTTPSGLAALPP